MQHAGYQGALPANSCFVWCAGSKAAACKHPVLPKKFQAPSLTPPRLLRVVQRRHLAWAGHGAVWPLQARRPRRLDAGIRQGLPLCQRLGVAHQHLARQLAHRRRHRLAAGIQEDKLRGWVGRCRGQGWETWVGRGRGGVDKGASTRGSGTALCGSCSPEMACKMAPGMNMDGLPTGLPLLSTLGGGVGSSRQRWRLGGLTSGMPFTPYSSTSGAHLVFSTFSATKLTWPGVEWGAGHGLAGVGPGYHWVWPHPLQRGPHRPGIAPPCCRTHLPTVGLLLLIRQRQQLAAHLAPVCRMRARR